MNKVNKKYALSKFQQVDERYAFLRGLGEVKQKDTARCKSELMAALNIKAEATFTRRKRGQIVPTVEEYQQIVQVFAKFGVKQPFGV